MDFIDQIRQLSSRIEKLKDTIQTEEATKTSMIMPFFATLGYDVFNPEEFVPEYTADVGIKKGEKVDYAIMNDGSPVILIEAKWCGEKLEKHDSQLFRYFGTTQAKFAILTNGITYKFFTDLDSPNKMDEKPFLVFNFLNIRDNQVLELKKFSKPVFDVDSILDTASELKYSNEFKNILAKELENPSDDFLKLFLSNAYVGVKTQNVLDKFRPVLKQALNNYISELMNDKIQTALTGGNANASAAVGENEVSEEENTSSSKRRDREIVTTDEELEAYFIIKNLLKEIVPMEEITYRDTVSYINILHKDNGRRWICRLILTDNQKTLIIPDENKNQQKFSLDNIYSLADYKDQLVESLNRFV